MRKKFKSYFKNTSIDDFRNSWYSEHLSAMREPVLYKYKSIIEVYRFTWLRTFDNPVAIRIEKIKDTYTLCWKRCNGEGGNVPGELTGNEQREINKEIWDRFQDRLNEIQFWKMDTTVSDGKIYQDGAHWILEGKVKRQYHVVDRWAPERDDSYYKCCDFLIGLTDLDIEERCKY